MSWYLRTSDACGSNQSTTKQYRSSFLPCAQARQQEAVVSEAACDERIESGEVLGRERPRRRSAARSTAVGQRRDQPAGERDGARHAASDSRLRRALRAIDAAPDRRAALDSFRRAEGAPFAQFLDDVLVALGVATRGAGGVVEFTGIIDCAAREET